MWAPQSHSPEFALLWLAVSLARLWLALLKHKDGTWLSLVQSRCLSSSLRDIPLVKHLLATISCWLHCVCILGRHNLGSLGLACSVDQFLEWRPLRYKFVWISILILILWHEDVVGLSHEIADHWMWLVFETFIFDLLMQAVHHGLERSTLG